VKHTIVALMQDNSGVLTRAVSLFRRRGYNIESLAVGPSERPGISRMTLVVDADNVEQVLKQLYRLIEVVKVSDVTRDATVKRETVLVKLHAPASRRTEISSLVHMFGARVVDVGINTLIVEATADPAKLDSFLELMRPFGIKELVRTGLIAMVRGTDGQRAPLDRATIEEDEETLKTA